MKSSLKNVSNELKGGIKTIDLASKSVTSLEKLLWYVVCMSGMIWAAWFVPTQFQIWMNNPTTIMKKEMTLDEVDYPAVSILTPGIPKYAIAERLGNYISTEKMPTEIINIRNLYAKCAMVLSQDNSGATNPIHKDRDFYDEYLSQCIYWIPTESHKMGCKVLI